MVRIDIKHIAKYLISCALLCSALVLHARDFEVGERLYFNGTPPSFNTWKNDAELWVQLKNGGNDWWLQAQWKGSIPYIEINSDCARDWTHVILARCQPGNRYNVYNKTGDISLHSYLNYIHDFAKGDGWKDANWGTYIPAPEGNPSAWAYEDEEICTSAAGSKYELTPINREYTDKTQNSSWFEYNGSSWKNLHGTDVWTQPGERNYKITLGSAGYDKYFFFQCSTPSKCRLIRIRLNQDCSPGAPGACKITSFIAVASDANVTDSTCAVDGLVAFDDKVNAGDLKIWCDDVDTVIFANGSVDTPQTFKLKGFDAKATKSYTLHAKFLNGNSECEDICYVVVSPPAVEPTIWDNTRTGAVGSHDRDLIRFTCEDVTLTPQNQTSKYFQWTNSDDDTKIVGAKPENRNITFTAPTEEKDIEYVFMATNEPPAPEGNLISNGSFEDPAKDTYLESNYDPWGRGKTNFYTGGNAGKSGGYAITDNAKTFWHDYQDITAHEGTYFGLFDSKIYDGTEQAAWIARSGSKNPNLKVQQGVSYLFSFWVANINTYDQMNNGARLQFQISYNGGSTWTNLGHEINLKNFKDHNWHGRSSIATPDETSSNVVIRVINLNQSDQNIGNDFALDDIRFEAVTSHSSNIAAYERFPVKYLKCEITGAIFEQPLSCGATKADVNYTINFVHPRGDLYIYEGETLLTHILHSEIGDETTSYTGVLKDQPVDNKKHNLIVYFDDGNVCAKDPKSYSYDSHAVPEISIESLTWGTVVCDVPTVTLTAVINYTNQNGKLTANVDGINADPAPTYSSIESDTQDQVTLTFPGITADGKTGHKLIVNFDGSHGCSIDYDIPEPAPYMPKIISTVGEVQPYKCGDDKYKVKITVNYTNSQDSDLVITDEAGNEKILKAAEYGATEASYTFEMPWEYPVSEHTFKAFFIGAKQCKDEPSHLCAYTAPAEPSISVDKSYIDVDCGHTTYTLQLKLTYINQKGSKFYASVDGGTAVEVDNPNPSAQTEKSDVTINVTGLLADGKEDHTYRIWTANTAEDCELSIPYKAPFAPVISNIKVEPQQMGCKETKYNVVVTFDVTNGQDSLVTVWGKADKHETFVAKEGENTVEFKDVEIDAADDYFDIWFEGAVNCKDKHHVEYKEPVTPHISVTQGPDVGDMGCNLTTYTVKFDITHTNQSGKLYGWIDDDIANKKEFEYEKNPATITFTDVPGDGLLHTLHAEFDGENSCSLEITDFKAPFTPTISNVTATPAQMGCDITKYNVTVDFVVTNGQSKEVTVQGKGQTKTVEAKEGDNSVTFEGIDIDSDTENDFFEVWFEDAENAADKCKKKVSYTEPVTPHIEITNGPAIGETACDKTTYTVKCDVTHINQNGKLLAWIDSNSKQEFSYDKNPVTIAFTDLPGDGLEHTFNIEFDGEHSCNLTQDFKAPFAPVIKGVVVGEPKYNCGDDKYEVELSISYANGLNHGVYIKEGSEVLAQFTTINDADSHTAEPVVLKLDFDAAHHLNVFFDGYETACPNAINIPSVAKPSLGTIKVNNATPCDGTTFDVEVEVQNFVNQDGTLTISFDEETVTSTDFTTNSATPQTKAITISGLKADISNTSHDLSVAFVSGSHGCSYSETIDIPVNPTLTGDTTAYYCYGEGFTWHGVNYTKDSSTPTHKYTSKVTGCDSIVTLQLIQLEPTDSIENVTICEGQTHYWHGNPYTEATDITETLTNAAGCDSVCTLHLTVNPKLYDDTIAYYCFGTSFEWHGVDYKASDPAPTHTYTSEVTGCDSIVTLKLTELPELKEDTFATITKGNFFTWHGVEYTKATTPAQHKYTSKVEPYCDSIVTLYVNEVDALVSDTFVTVCHGASFEWYGTSYYATDPAPTHKFISKVPPYTDSIVTLNIIELPVLQEDTFAYYCNGHQFEWYGVSYTKDTDPAPTHTYTSKVTGCDSIVTLKLIQLEPTDSIENVTICEGQTHYWHGNPYTEATDITETLTNAAGCDSVCTLHLTVNPVPQNPEETVTVFAGQTYNKDGVEYAEGDHTIHLSTAEGCPYDLILHVIGTEKPVIPRSETRTVCEGESVTDWYEIVTPTLTNYTFTNFRTGTDADTLVTLTVTVNPILAGDTTAYYCNGHPFEWFGVSYTKDTDPAPTHTYTSLVTGCDSIVTLHLIQLEPTDSIENVTICEGQTHYWHGNPYTEATDITETFTNAAGCDSVCTLHLAVNPKLTGDTTAYYCSGHSFKWHGVGYTTADPAPSHTYTSKVTGCDSIVTLQLIQLEPTDSIENVTICEGQTHYWHGNPYTEATDITETLTNAAGCDSVCTLHLTVNPKLYDDTIAYYCFGTSFEWFGVSYTKDTYPAPSHTYTSKVTGCDSIVTLHFIQLEPTDSIEIAHIFIGQTYTWHGLTFTASTTQTETLTNAAGCDSVCTLKLTVSDKLIYDSTETYTICKGETIDWYDGSHQPTASGKIASHTITGAEKDTLIVLDVTVHPTLHGDTTASICQGEAFTWHGITYTSDIDVPHTYTSRVTGCDSIVTLHLRTTPLPTLTVCSDTEIDPGESVLLWATGADFIRWEPENSIEMTADYERYAHPTTTTTYTVTGYNLHANHTGNLVYNGDFELGNTGFVVDLSYCEACEVFGTYMIADNVQAMWSSIPSVKAYGGSGLMMIADGATEPNSIVWQQKVSVEPNTYYAISAQFMSLHTSNMYGQYALFQFDVNGEQVGPIFHSPTTLYEWEKFYNTWYSGSSTTATITIYNQNSSGEGNDFALDEIRFEPLSEGCEVSKTVTITVRGTRTDSVEIAHICRGETYTWHGQTFTEAITKTETLINAAGGDSVCTLILSVSEPTDSIETVTICAGETHTWHGQTFTSSITKTEILSNAAGCDSVCTLHLTVNPTLTGDTTATITKGTYFTWHSVDYTEADPTPTHTYISKIAPYCDSIVTLHVHEIEALVGDTFATICHETGAFSWHGVTYSTDGNYQHTYKSVADPERDSVVTLHLTILPQLIGDTTAYYCFGGAFNWHGVDYTTVSNPEPTHTYTSSVAPYCDSIVTLHLIEWPELKDDTTAYYCAGYSFEWYGVNYTSADPAPTHTYTSKVTGCDSIVTLNLIELPTLTGDTTATITKGNFFTWYGLNYTAADPAPTHTYTSKITGCDSIVTLHVHEIEALVSDTVATFCKGSSFTWHGVAYDTAGDYPYTYISKVTGCDSIVTLHLTQLEPSDSIETVTICAGETHTWHGKTFTATTTQTKTIENAAGCDSVCTLKLTVLPALTGDTAATFCKGSSFTWNGVAYDAAGDYPHTYTSKVTDCDSIVTLHLTQLEPSDSLEVVTICAGASHIWHGQTFTSTTTITETIENAAGCDSVCTLKLTVLSALTGDTAATFCNGSSFTWHGVAYDAAGDYPHTYTSKVTGCDSIVTLHLTQLEPTDSIEIVSICAGETHTWHGQTFTSSVTKTETIDNAAGCDSVCTLKLTVLPQLTGDTTAYYCAGSSFEWHGAFYTTADVPPTHTYTSKVTGCDSIVTLKLIEYPTYNMPAEEATIIDGETYTWNGMEYETGGVYSEKLETKAHGCDSIVTLNLTVLENNVENVALNIAEQCAGEGALEIAVQHTGYLTDAQLTFDEKALQAGFVNGTYPIENDIVTIPYNVRAGIFSVKVDLWFHNRHKHSSTEPFTLLFPSSVLEQGWMDAVFVLTHDYNGGYDFKRDEFQWYKNGQKLEGETGPYLYQPLTVGDQYSAMLTEVNLGIRLMTCPLTVTEHTDITLYPTLVTRKDMLRVHVSQDAVITLYSLMGERVSTHTLIHGDTQIEAPGAQGIYLAEVVLESGPRKVIKLMVR